MRDDDERTNKQTVKIELLSQWKLEAEFRKSVEYFPEFNIFVSDAYSIDPALVAIDLHRC